MQDPQLHPEMQISWLGKPVRQGKTSSRGVLVTVIQLKLQSMLQLQPPAGYLAALSIATGLINLTLLTLIVLMNSFTSSTAGLTHSLLTI